MAAMARMHSSLVAAALTLVLVGASCGSDDPDPVGSSESPHWEYEGSAGPDAWGSLSAEYSACGEGRAQSPIDLGVAVATDSPDLVVDYRSGAVTIVDNGHTVQANVDEAESTVAVDGDVYSLTQMHFHAPSEHTIDGEFAAAEVHFVHKSDAGDLAVIGVLLMETSERNEAWAAYTDAADSADSEGVAAVIDWPALLPDDAATIRYSGSLTTPPCSEGVRWMVMATPVQVAAEQVAALTAIHSGNHRPVQALNDREVLFDTADG